MANPQQQAAPQQPEWKVAWDSLQKSPEYQNAGSDLDREGMRLEVFRDYVAPNLASYEMEKGFKEFNKRTAPTGDPTSGIAGDTAAAIKSGLWNVGGDIASAFTLGDPNAVSLGMKSKGEDAWNQASPSAIQDTAAFGIDYKEGEGLGGLSFKEGSTGYGAYLNTIKGGVSMVPMMAGGGMFGLAAKGISRVAGVTKATKAAVAAKNMQAAHAAMQTADKITKVTQFGGQSALMGAMIGGSTSDQAFNEVYNQPEAVLAKSEIYQGYLNQGMNKAQARDTIARDAAKSAFGGGFTLGFASGGLYGKFLDKMLKGNLGATTRLGNVGRGAVGETLQETVESSGQQYLSNVAQGDVGLNVDPMKDVIAQGATGALLGGLMGGPIGGFSGGQAAPNLDKITGELKAAQENRNTLEMELSGELDEATRTQKEATLEKTYRSILDMEAVQTDLMKKGQKPTPEAAAGKPATEKAATAEAEPDVSEANWVPSDLDDQIRERIDQNQKLESKIRRATQNGAGMDDNWVMQSKISENKAMLKRFAFMRKNIDKQSYFDNKDSFYGWVEASIGTPDEMASASQELKQRQGTQALGGDFVNNLEPELKLGMQEQLVREATANIPTRDQLRRDTQEVKKEGLANRTRETARNKLDERATEKRQQQFEDLKNPIKAGNQFTGNGQTVTIEEVSTDPDTGQEMVHYTDQATGKSEWKRREFFQNQFNAVKPKSAPESAPETKPAPAKPKSAPEEAPTHEQKPVPTPKPVAKRTVPATPAAVAAEKAEQTPAKTDAGTVSPARPKRELSKRPESKPRKPGVFESTPERQRSRLTYLAERLEAVGSPQTRSAAKLLRGARATMASHGNSTVTIGGNVLTIKNGRVDKTEFDQFTRAMARKAPRSRAQQTATVTNAAARTIKTIRDRFANLDDDKSQRLFKLADRVIFVLEKRGVMTQKYGDGKVLRIEAGGKVAAKDLREFRQWLESEENTTAGYWQNTLQALYKTLKTGPRNPQTIAAEVLIKAIKKKESRRIGYDYPDTKHVRLTNGEPDYTDVRTFVNWLNRTPTPAKVETRPPKTGGRGSLAEQHTKAQAEKERKIRKEQAKRQQYADYFHRRARKAIANNNQAIITIGALTDSHQEFADSSPDSKTKAIKGKSAINAMKEGNTKTIFYGAPSKQLKIRTGKARGKDLDEFVEYLSSTEIPPKAPPKAGSSFADEATHIWTNPETGEKVPVIYEGRSEYDMDLYLDENAEEYTGDKSQFQPTGNRNVAEEAEAEPQQKEKERQQKEKELAELDRQDREQESQSQEQAAEDRQKRIDAQQQAEEQAESEKEQAKLQEDQELLRTAEEKIKRETEQLEQEKQEIDKVNAELEPERKRRWTELRKKQTGGEQGPAKISWKHSRLVNANIIGNTRGEGFSKEYKAKATLSQNQLEDTHFVYKTSAGDFFLKRKEQLEPASIPVKKPEVVAEPEPELEAEPSTGITPDTIKAGDPVPIIGKGSYTTEFFAPWDNENGKLTITANPDHIVITIKAQDRFLSEFTIPRDEFFANYNNEAFIDNIVSGQFSPDFLPENAQYDSDYNFARQNFYKSLSNFARMFGNGQAPLSSKQLSNRINKWLADNNHNAVTDLNSQSTSQLLDDISKGDMTLLNALEYYLSNKDARAEFPAMDSRIDASQNQRPNIATRQDNGQWMLNGHTAMDTSMRRPIERPARPEPKSEPKPEPRPKPETPSAETKPTGPKAKVTIKEMGPKDDSHTTSNMGYAQIEVRLASKRDMTPQQLANVFKHSYESKIPDAEYLIAIFGDLVTVSSRHPGYIQPPNGWKNDTNVVKDFATGIGIKITGKTPKALIKEIEDFLADQKERRDVSTKPEKVSTTAEPRPETIKTNEELVSDIQDLAGLSNDDLYLMEKEGLAAWNKYRDLPPAQQQDAESFYDTGLKPTSKNVKDHLESKGMSGYLEREIKNVQKNLKLVKPVRNRIAAIEEKSRRKKEKKTAVPDDGSVGKFGEALVSETFFWPGPDGIELTEREALTTATGRKTTGIPKTDFSTRGKAKNSEKRIHQWLMDNAIEEAKARGDDFNLRQFEANKDRPSIADLESANVYLFDQASVQPATRPVLKPLVPETTTVPAPLAVGSRVKTRYSYGVITSLGSKYAQVVDDYNGGSTKEPIATLTTPDVGDRTAELHSIIKTLEDRTRRALKKDPSVTGKYIFDRIIVDGNTPIRSEQQVQSVLTSEGINTPAKEWMRKLMGRVKKELSNNDQITQAAPEKAPTTVYEADQRLESNKVNEEVKGQLRQEIDQKVRRSFAQQYSGTDKAAPFAFVQSLVNRDYEKAIDDVARGRLTDDQAWDVADAALMGKALTRDEFDTFVHKLKQLRKKPVRPAPDGSLNALETDLARVLKPVAAIMKEKPHAMGGFHGYDSPASLAQDVLYNLTIKDIEARIKNLGTYENAGIYQSAYNALLNIRRKIGRNDYGTTGINWDLVSPVAEPEASPKKKRQLRRNAKLIEIDAELKKANEEVSAAFVSALSAPSSAVAYIFEKVLPLSVKLGSLYVQKGILKFGNWADNMLAGLDSEGIDPDDVLPHLKGIYAAVKQNATDKQFDQMDSEGDVRKFDLESLFDEDIETEITQSDIVNTEAALPPQAHTTTLSQSMFHHLQGGNPLGDNRQLKKFIAERNGIKPSEVTAEMMKAAQEALEVALVMRARETIASGQDTRTIFDSLVQQYEAQPNLDIRSSESMENQAYSTPSPMAYVGSLLAGVNQQSTVYDPTGGNAMLLIAGDINKSTVNEINNDRVQNLKELGYQPTQENALDFVPDAKHSAIATNPPFGKLPGGKIVKIDGYNFTKLDYVIPAKALETMEDDGKAVIIIGANSVQEPGIIGSADKVFFNWLYAHYNVVDHFEASGDLYKRQGAGWPVRIITVHGRKASNKRSPVSGTIERFDNWNDIYDHYQSVMDTLRDAEQRGKSGTVSEDITENNGSANTPGPSFLEILGSGQGNAGNGKRGENTGRPAADSAGTGRPQHQPGSGSDGGLRSGNITQEPANLSQQGNNRPGNKPASTGTVSTQRTGSTGKPVVSSSTFQTKYNPGSNGFNEAVLTPVNMATSTEKALAVLKAHVGEDIDLYVADKLGYDSVEDLYRSPEGKPRLMALQIDSIAAAIFNAEVKNKGIIIADQTGVGKGRQAAGIMRYAARNGKIPIFVTVTSNLFTDMYNDLKDIGSDDINPLIMNIDASVKQRDADGNPLPDLFTNARKRTVNKVTVNPHMEMLEEIARTGELPAGKNALFMTYSQVGNINTQREVLRAFGDKAFFVLDEAHNAAGDFESKIPISKGGGTRQTTAGFFAEVLGAGNVTYLSATYAKRPDNMGIYFRTDLMDAVDNFDDLVSAMEVGGVPLQTVISNMLAESGQLFRRERSFEGINIPTVVDYENSARHREVYDQVTDGLRSVMDADEIFQKYFLPWAKENAEQLGEEIRAAGNQAAKSIDHNGFTSIVHNYISQLLMAMKADGVVQDSIRLHGQDKKPVIATTNTLESFIGSIVERHDMKVGDRFDFNYRDILLMALERTRRLSYKDATGESQALQIELDQLDDVSRSAYEEAEKAILSLDIADLPVSPIDYIRQKLEDEGIRMGEITGRSWSIDYSGEYPVLAKRSTKEVKDRRSTVDEFNNGQLNGILLNQAGSTGLSIHASEGFIDQKIRHMLVMQPSLNVNIMMQMLGRINRTGQNAIPEYTLMALDLPAEKRPAAILSEKMRSLNANTSANSDSDTSINAPNILNKYGNQIVNAFLVDNLPLASRLDLHPTMEEGKEPPPTIARQFTGRLALLPVVEQEDAYAVVEADFNNLIEYLDKTGQNDLNPQTLDLDAKILSSEIIYQGKAPGTVFGGDTTLHKIDSRYQGNPPKPDDVSKALDKSLGDQSPTEATQAILDAKAADGAVYLAGIKGKISAATATIKAEFKKDKLEEIADQVEVVYGTFFDKINGVVNYLEGSEDYGEDHKLTKKYRALQERRLGYGIAEVQYNRNKETTEEMLNTQYRLGNHVELELADESVTGVVTRIQDSHVAGKGNPYAFSKTKITLMVNTGIRQVVLPLNQLKEGGGIYKGTLRTSGKQNLETIFEPFASTGERRETRYLATGNLIAGVSELKDYRGRIVAFTSNGKTYQGVLLPKVADPSKAGSKVPTVALRDPVKTVKFLKANQHNRLIQSYGITSKDNKIALRKGLGNDWQLIIPQSNKHALARRMKFDPQLREAMGKDFFSAGKGNMSAFFDESKLDATVERLLEMTSMTALGSFKDELNAVGIGGTTEAVKAFDEREATEAKYRLAEPDVKGLRPYLAKTLQRMLDKALGKIVSVVQSEANLPKHLRDQIASDHVSGQVKGIYDERTGTTYVIADRSESVSDAIKTALHEAVGHKGIRNVLGAALNKTLDQVYASLGKPQQDALRKAYSEQLAGESPKNQQRIIAEEYLAHLAETNPDHRWFKTVMARLRSWLRSHLPGLKWSQNDMRQLIMDAKQSVTTTPPVINTRNAQIRQRHIPRTGPAAVRYQLGKLPKLDQQALDQLKESAQKKGTTIKEFTRRNGLGFLGGKQITEIYSPIFKAVTEKFGHNPLVVLDKLYQKMTSDRSNYAHVAEQIDQLWSKLARAAPNTYNLLSNVMHTSTLIKQDPREAFQEIGDKSIATLQKILVNPKSEAQRAKFQRQLDRELAREAQYDALKKQWDALGKDSQAQQIYTKVEKFYREQFLDTREALMERIEGTDLDPNAKKSAMTEIKLMFHDAISGPYFPLMRFGDYVITAKDAQGKPYRAHYETKVARDAARGDLVKAGYKIEFTGMRENFDPTKLGGVGQFSGKIKALFEGDLGKNVPEDDYLAIMREINQITLDLLPEMSAGKRSMGRKGVAGYHENARRAFDATALTSANRIGKIRYGWQMESEIAKMQEAASEDEATSLLTSDQRDIASQVHMEMLKRHDLIMNPTGNQIASVLTNVGFIFYLGGSIGAGIVNLTQNLLIALPQMGAKYGFRKTAKIMGQVAADYFKHGGPMPKGLDNMLQNSWFSLDRATGLPADEVALIQQLINDGTIETTQAHVLAQMADTDIRPEDVRKKDWYTKVTRASGMFFHNAEVMNRQIAALTAYRLAKADGKITLEGGKPSEATVDAIRKAVFDAHYDYSGTNRPRNFKGNWAKVFLLFKQYSQNTTYFLARNFYQSLKGESQEIKDQARKTLTATLAMHGVFAGAMGLPMVSTLFWIAGMAMGDEDDPFDAETETRNLFADVFGKTAGHALAKGLLNAFTGLDFHSRTGVQDLWYRGSNYDMTARQEAMNFAVTSMGPLAGLGINLWTGVDKFANGEQWQGLEGMMPKFIRDGMKTIRYNTEGVQNAQGKTLLNDFSPWESFAQSVGIGSSRLSEVYDVNAAVTGKRTAIQRRRTQLMGQMDKADTQKERQKVQQRINAFNDVQRERNRNWAVIKPANLKSSLQRRQKTRDESEYGVFLSSTMEKLRDEGRFGAVQRF